MLFLLKILIDFLLQDNAIILYLKSLKKLLVAYGLSYVLEHRQNIFFLFSNTKH